MPCLEQFDHPGHQALAAEALQDCGTPAVVDRMLERITDPSPRVRYYAATVLSAFEDERSVRGLRALVGDDNDDVRFTAVAALAAQHSETATEVMLALFNDPDDLVRLLARSAVFTAGPDNTARDLASRPRYRHPDIRAQAADALATHGRAPDITQMLLELAADPEASVRSHAASALSGHGGQAVVDALTRLLSDTDCRVAAAGALGRHDTPEARLRLLDWLNDATAPECLIAGAKSLGASTSAAAADTLLRYSDNPDDSVRAAFMTALGKLTDARAVSRLVRALTEDKSPDVRAAAATALRPRSEYPAVVTALLAGLCDSNDQVREASARAIGADRDRPEVISALIERLSDNSQSVRDAAAWQLQECTTLDALCQVCQLAENAQGTALTLVYYSVGDLAQRLRRSILCVPRIPSIALTSRVALPAVRP